MKHLSTAHDDPAIIGLIAELGLEAYAIYWLLLEHMAGGIQRDSEAIPTRTYTVIDWARICQCSTRKFRRFVAVSSQLRLICVETATNLRRFSAKRLQNQLTIQIPKLLKYRDEYSKKSGHLSGVTPDKLRTIDTDTEADTDIPPKSPAAHAEAKHPTELEVLVSECARTMYRNHPQLRRDCSARVVEKNLRAALKRHCPKKSLEEKKQFLAELRRSHEARCDSGDWQKDGGQYAKGLSNYMAPTMDRYLPAEPVNGIPIPGKRWEDYTPEERAELPSHMNPNLWSDD